MANCPEERARSWKYDVSSQSPDQSYDMIDLLKYLFAFLVFLIHCAPFSVSDFSYAKVVNFALIQYAARIAVPFFFACAGFFLFRKIDPAARSYDRVLTYVARLGCMFALWWIILSLSDTLHLWYLSALIVASILISTLMFFHVPLKAIFAIGAVLYVFGLLGDTYRGLLDPVQNFALIRGYESVFNTTRNGLFMGVPFMCIGIAFAKKKIVMSKLAAVSGLIVSLLFLLAEVFAIHELRIAKDYNMFVFLLPVTFFILYIGTHRQISPRPIYKRMRTMSVIVYLSHPMIIKSVRALADAIDSALTFKTPQLVIFFLSLSVTMLTAYLLETLSHKYPYLKYLF